MTFPLFARRAAALPLVVVAAFVGASTAAAAPAALPLLAPGAPGPTSLGDTLFPDLGNGGYDALHYDVDLTFGATPTSPITGRVTLIARATQPLSRFSLDFSGTAVGSVLVNGSPATVARTATKLVITPSRVLRRGLPFFVTMRGFVATPRPYDSDDPTSVALVATPSGTLAAGQPAYAHGWFPSNDHPRDKASYRFLIAAPESDTAAANGVLTGKWTRKGVTHWTYVQRQPMATELIQLAVGAYDIIDRGTSDGVHLRDVTVRSATASLRPLLEVERSQLDWMRSKVGRYPFDAYGSLVTDPSVGFALETQTLSLFDTSYYTDLPVGAWQAVMVHELAHQWFGDDVAPGDWADIWLNEGHATWYETTWAAEHGVLADDNRDGIADFDELNRSIYAAADQARAEHGPVARPLSGEDGDIFSTQSYEGGQLVLYALRERIGRPAFERLERAWVAKYRGRSATTNDFIRLASKVSGQDLTAFLTAWLYGTTTPPMPNHPDWTVDPVGAPKAQARSAGTASAGAIVDRRRR